MEIRKLDDNRILLELERNELDALATPILNHAEDMSSTPLDLAYLIRDAKYTRRFEFRQPPHAWEPGVRHPRVGK